MRRSDGVAYAKDAGVPPVLGRRAARRVSLYNDAFAVLVSSGASKLADARYFGRLAGTAIVVLGVAGAFLNFGGWFNPAELTRPPTQGSQAQRGVI
jgi:hypothetical protein